MRVPLYHTPDAGRTWAQVRTGKRYIDAVFGRGPRQVRAVGVFHSGSIGPCVHNGTTGAIAKHPLVPTPSIMRLEVSS